MTVNFTRTRNACFSTEWKAAEQSSSLGVAILRRVFPLSPIFASVHWVNTMDTDEWDSTERERLGILTDMITLWSNFTL